MLSAEEEAEIAKNLRKYSKKYEVEDAEQSNINTAQDLEHRRKLMDDWKSWVSRWKQMYEEEKPYREDLRDGEPSDDDEDLETEEVEVEEIMKCEEEVISYGFEQVD